MVSDIQHHLYLKDCVEGVKELADASLDLVLSGPPYFNHVVYSQQPENLSTKGLDDFLAGLGKLWQNLEPKLKPGGIVALWLHDIYLKKENYFTLCPLHSELLKTFPAGLNLRQIVIWDRYLHKTYEQLPTEENFGSKLQYILLFSKGRTNYEKTLEKFYWNPIWGEKTVPKFLGSRSLYQIIFQIGKSPLLYRWLNPWFAPAKKIFFKDKYQFTDYLTTCPEEVAEMLIGSFSREGDTVCDPFLGSGTTMKVAHRLRRICLGFEINPAAKPVILKKIETDQVKIFE